MPFGKYRGAEVDDLEENYLLWLWANVNLYEPLRSEVRRRLYGDAGEVMTLEPEKIKRVYRELAMSGTRTEAAQSRRCRQSMSSMSGW